MQIIHLAIIFFMNNTQPQEIIDFWYKESQPQDWFVKNTEFDKQIHDRFLPVYNQAIKGELYTWRITPQGRLAEIIVLDQFARNLFRNNPQAFAYDTMALALAQEAIQAGDDKKLEQNQRWFLYMPFMHSESKAIHEQSIKLFTELGQQQTLQHAIDHKKIIDQFGRYPHRNKVLGRNSTPEEVKFLNNSNYLK